MVFKWFLLLFICLLGYGYTNISPEGFERFKNYYFVETGTFLGDGIKYALRANFKQICSIEMDKNLYKNNCKRFRKKKNVFLFQGDSSKDLWAMIKNLNKPITFWLDAHNGSPDINPQKKNTPLLEELEQIKRHPIKTHTIMIDDMRCCNKLLFDYLTKEDIIKKIKEINPHYKISYINGGNRGEYPNNIMVAQVK